MCLVLSIEVYAFTFSKIESTSRQKVKEFFSLVHSTPKRVVVFRAQRGVRQVHETGLLLQTFSRNRQRCQNIKPNSASHDPQSGFDDPILDGVWKYDAHVTLQPDPSLYLIWTAHAGDKEKCYYYTT